MTQSNHQCNTREIEDVATFYCRINSNYLNIQIFLFLITILEWIKLDMEIRRPDSFLSFKNSLLKIDQLAAKPTYNIHNPISLKFCTRLRLN